jgi:diaminopimelate epimerase
VIPFVKTHALGNDFILVEHTPAVPQDYPEFARRICHRYFGVGGDGVILWKKEADKVPIRIFNQDGSEAECSGNGLRCVAAYMIESGLWPSSEIRIETVSGMYTLNHVGAQYSADMGVPKIDKVDSPLEIDGERLRITTCSTGNPHCSLFVDRLDDAFVQRVGPKLEHHSMFPNRTNVEFIHVLTPNQIEVAFWERGVGVTYASGTGSCGAVVACIVNGKTDRDVTVHTKAGQLRVEWPEGGRLKLTSTANIVAEGKYFS